MILSYFNLMFFSPPPNQKKYQIKYVKYDQHLLIAPYFGRMGVGFLTIQSGQVARAPLAAKNG